MAARCLRKHTSASDVYSGHDSGVSVSNVGCAPLCVGSRSAVVTVFCVLRAAVVESLSDASELLLFIIEEKPLSRWSWWHRLSLYPAPLR